MPALTRLHKSGRESQGFSRLSRSRFSMINTAPGRMSPRGYVVKERLELPLTFRCRP